MSVSCQSLKLRPPVQTGYEQTTMSHITPHAAHLMPQLRFGDSLNAIITVSCLLQTLIVSLRAYAQLQALGMITVWLCPPSITTAALLQQRPTPWTIGLLLPCRFECATQRWQL
jgi:hypothetical protein